MSTTKEMRSAESWVGPCDIEIAAVELIQADALEWCLDRVSHSHSVHEAFADIKLKLDELRNNSV